MPCDGSGQRHIGQPNEGGGGVKHVSEAVISGISGKFPLLKSHTHLENTKRTLVAHPNQTAERQLQDHGALEGHKVPHVLQQEELWSVVITVTAREKRPNFYTLARLQQSLLAHKT